jgi:hypothetical protein
MHIDYKEVRKTPIETILQQRGVEYKRQGVMLVAKACPLPSHASKDTFTFKASLETNLWTCHSTSCKKASGSNGGDVIDLVCLLDSIPPLEAARKLAGVVVTAATASPKRPISTSGTGRNEPLGFALKANPEHPMIQGRGISVETARLYGIGFYRSRQHTASMDDRIIFPLLENNVLVGYGGRTVLPVTPENPKWKVGKGVVKTMCFGVEHCDPAQPLVLCESPWEVLLASQLRRHAAALMGTAMSEEQERQLDPFGTIWVMMDDDDAGRAASEVICERLARRHKIIRSFLKD